MSGTGIGSGSNLGLLEFRLVRELGAGHDRTPCIYLAARSEEKAQALHPQVQRTAQTSEVEVFRHDTMNHSRFNRYRPLVQQACCGQSKSICEHRQGFKPNLDLQYPAPTLASASVAAKAENVLIKLNRFVAPRTLNEAEDILQR